MLSFIVTHFLEIIFGLISFGALAFCKYMWGQMNKYRQLLNKEEDTELEKTIDDRVEPIKRRIEQINTLIDSLQIEEKRHMDSIIASYRFRLKMLCKACIKQGYATTDQYEQISEFYKIYSDLGGNGQIQDYYEQVMKLEINDNKKQGIL